MPRVFIPTMLQPLTKGVKEVRVEAKNVRQIVDALEVKFPGIKERLVEDGQLMPNLAVSVDGEMGRLGLMEKVGPDSEVHFIPAIGGGSVTVLGGA